MALRNGNIVNWERAPLPTRRTFMPQISQITIPLQQKRVTDPAVLLPEEADAFYSTPEQLVEALNNILYETYTAIRIPIYPPLRSLLDSFISDGLDFGAIYARLRPHWSKVNSPLRETSPESKLVSGISSIERIGEAETQNRERSIEGESIAEPGVIGPRRIWDLHANRVIPFHLSYTTLEGDPGAFWAISHSWTSDMRLVDTPVNGHEWPVPVPEGVTLEAVRNEVLNTGEANGVETAEYVWLDVLCLRQASGDPDDEFEQERTDEWRVDLPTIGIVFHDYVYRVIRYMNGLGRAFMASGWDDDKHWLNRAWTLQEAKAGSIIGGIPSGVWDPREVVSKESGERLQDRLLHIDDIENRRQSLNDEDSFVHLVNAMRLRRSTNAVDKVFGIGMIFCKNNLPLYDGSMDPEAAWAKCVEHLPVTLLAVFLFLFPPGDGVAWRPSWDQLMAKDYFIYETLPCISYTALSISRRLRAFYVGPVVEAHLTPLSRTSLYRGHRLTLQGDSSTPGENITVQVKLHWNKHVPDDDYILVGAGNMTHCLVCTGVRTPSFFEVRKIAGIDYADSLQNFLMEKASVQNCWFL